MIKRYNYNLLYNTGSIIKNIEEAKDKIIFDYRYDNNKNIFKYEMNKNTIIYGLGENVRGINKRGWVYTSFNTDDPDIHETRSSLYASHNFIIIIDENKKFGAFFDTPSEITFDLGYQDIDCISVETENGLNVYIIEDDSIDGIIKEFREIIGESYIPPFWAFGFCQSRWGYKTKEDVLDIVKNYEINNLPLDSICLDIDCLDNYKDFTFNSSFDNKKDFITELKNKNIRLVPIVDAAIKKDGSYYIYNEMLKNKYYCMDKDSNPYFVGVWPGDSLLPDYLNNNASKWFGSKYKELLDLGIEGFWNDMNEPALFYSRNHVDEVFKYIGEQVGKNFEVEDYFKNKGMVIGLQNNLNYYKELYHNIDGKLIRHYDIHNLYGYKMAEAASLYFKEYNKNKRYLLYSRSSHIGSHRYSGIWTGDNASWWNHILLNLKMLPSLNMCGYMYIGADSAGFGQNTTEDLAIRWAELSIFTPLFRNHSAKGTRNQEYYNFKNIDIFRNILSIRYMILPYLYSEFIKAVKTNSLLYKPLFMEFSNDERTREIEDEIIFGESILLAPIYVQNASGRYVYLPDDYLEVRVKNAKEFITRPLTKGDHYIKMNLDEVVFFIRKGYAIPIYKEFAKNVYDINYDNLSWIKNNDNLYEYTLVDKDDNYRTYKIK